MSFQPYQPAPESSRFRRAATDDRDARVAGIMMRISRDEAEKQNGMIAESGKFGTVAPVGNSGFAGDRLAGALGSINKAAGAIGGLLNQGGSQPWHQNTNFNPAGNTPSGFDGGPTYKLMPDLAQYKHQSWTPSSTLFGN